MPFYGRPSKNCESCRIRRIKCDRIEPVCSQCKRAGKPCGGYRDIPALLFRDENDKTVQRSVVAKSKSEARRKLLDEFAEVNYDRPVHMSKSSRLGLIVRRDPEVFWISAIPAVMPSSLEDQGLKFFFNRFATSIQKATKNPISLEMPELEMSPLMATIPNELPLRDAVMAVGLAAMSNVTHDHSLLQAARVKYLAALNIVRAAVENPQRANPVLIFKLILMLSLFEMVCCPSRQVDSWVVHLDGMAALLKQASFSKALNADTRPQLQYLFISIVRYFMVQGDLPSVLITWSPDRISTVTPFEEPAVDLVDILIRFAKLHYTARNDPDLDHGAIASSAASFDTELDEWEKNLPDKWAFTLSESKDHQHTFNGKYLIYNDVWASRILNNYFWGRLVVNEIILKHLASHPSPTRRTLQQRQRALETSSRLSINVCAGAASHMGAFGNMTPATGDARLPPLNGAFTLLFPLTMAGGAAGAPDEAYEWVIQTLQRIGETMGIQRALQLIPALKEIREKRRDQNLEADEVFARLG
ncbi:hypothetical protein N7509_001678 [Penicillium cosmopolitanum]|uniref:Zn(2)-C6 fungal-type domain-containing protein n=1 Tax=Penicillium cosmopolitanum TaxID=1131564 RepID=A0A9W9W7G0_9EURO|nr:uncharacterized protein N7509_001678 [Penicillium cosmopolitanum]KAJ5407795.1 hypothetical protein N7509_001678 [Penicillium cosmopolitanum]